MSLPQPCILRLRKATQFIAGIDPSLPVCFLAFRPNFVFENHPGAGLDLMHRCVEVAAESGLTKAHWSGYTGLPGISKGIENEVRGKYTSREARLSASYAWQAHCKTHPRDCLTVISNQACRIKIYSSSSDLIISKIDEFCCL